MTLLKEMRDEIKYATARYEAAEELAEHFAGRAIEAWTALADVYEAEDRELDRIDIEGE